MISSSLFTCNSQATQHFRPVSTGCQCNPTRLSCDIIALNDTSLFKELSLVFSTAVVISLNRIESSYH